MNKNKAKENEITKYILSQKKISITRVMAHFQISYDEASSILWILEKKHRISRMSEFSYVVVEDELDEDEEDDDEIIQKINLEENTDSKNENKFDTDTDEHSDAVNNIYYGSLFDDGFNMEKAKESVPEMEIQIAKVIDDIKKSPDELEKWEPEKDFENLCMDVIESVVIMNREWTRQDAIVEAAKQLVAVKYTFQGKQACDVHTRVLREFMIATDDEYNLLRQQLWGTK